MDDSSLTVPIVHSSHHARYTELSQPIEKKEKNKEYGINRSLVGKVVLGLAIILIILSVVGVLPGFKSNNITGSSPLNLSEAKSAIPRLAFVGSLGESEDGVYDILSVFVIDTDNSIELISQIEDSIRTPTQLLIHPNSDLSVLYVVNSINDGYSNAISMFNFEDLTEVGMFNTIILDDNSEITKISISSLGDRDYLLVSIKNNNVEELDEEDEDDDETSKMKIYELDRINGDLMSNSLSFNEWIFDTKDDSFETPKYFKDILFISSNDERNELYFIGISQDSTNLHLLTLQLDSSSIDDNWSITEVRKSITDYFNEDASAATDELIVSSDIDDFTIKEMIYNDEYSMIYVIFENDNDDNEENPLIFTFYISLPSGDEDEDDEFDIEWKQVISFSQCLSLSNMEFYYEYCLTTCVTETGEQDSIAILDTKQKMGKLFKLYTVTSGGKNSVSVECLDDSELSEVRFVVANKDTNNIVIQSIDEESIVTENEHEYEIYSPMCLAVDNRDAIPTQLSQLIIILSNILQQKQQQSQILE